MTPAGQESEPVLADQDVVVRERSLIPFNQWVATFDIGFDD